MADYWKSQPRKFCQYCKCWIADNKPSIEFHERGKNHKQNVAAKIEEIKKKSIDKAKKEEKMSKEFAAMEEAALKAYEEDMKRLRGESVVSEAPARSQKKSQKSENITTVTRTSSKSGAWLQGTTVTCTSSESDAWVPGTTDDGLTYFYNTVTGESQWEKPGGFQGESVTPPTNQTEVTSGSAWMEALSPDGFTYYYNTETGESSWEKPAEASPAEASPAEASPAEAGPAEEGPAEETSGQQVSSTSQSDTLSEEEETSAAQTDTTGQPGEKLPRVPKISFRKRKEGTAQVAKEESEEEDEEEEEEEEDKTVKPSAEVKETPAKKPRTAAPYGEWEQIQEEENPYDNIDLQLPQTEGGATSSTPVDLPAVPKAKFRERTITSLGDDCSSETTFKKRKTENGKSRGLRQRGKDD